MRIYPRALSLLLLPAVLMSLSTPALAARSYLIELIVFSMNDRGADEKWTAANPPLNSRKLATARLPEQIMSAFRDEPAEISASTFSQYVNRIRKNPYRNIILSTHWVQTVLEPGKTTIARITNRKDILNSVNESSSATKPGMYDNQPSSLQPVLDGFINFYLAGQYTIEADIRYTPAYRPSILDDEMDTGPVSYRIYEKRRIKSGEVNYYDHPKIGMVLMVTPVEIPDADSRQKTKD